MGSSCVRRTRRRRREVYSLCCSVCHGGSKRAESSYIPEGRQTSLADAHCLLKQHMITSAVSDNSQNTQGVLSHTSPNIHLPCRLTVIHTVWWLRHSSGRLAGLQEERLFERQEGGAWSKIYPRPELAYIDGGK